MSNLTDLLPAGAGGKQVDFVASGALSSGVTVALNSDGTVEAITGVTEGVGTPVVFDAGNPQYVSAVYDATNNKVVVAYRDQASTGYGTAVVGTVSGDTISFGSYVYFNSSDTYETSATYDSNSNKVVIVYRDAGNSNYGKAIVGTVSGTSISFGTAVVFESASTSYCAAAYDSTNNKVVIAYNDGGNSNYGTGIVGTVSGTSISFGTAVVFESGNTVLTAATFDSANNKVVIAYSDVGNSNYGTAVVGTVSGTSISFGSPVIFLAYSAQGSIAITYDSNAQKVVVIYQDSNNGYYGAAKVGTVSGTSISFGSAGVFAQINTEYSAVFDSNSNKVVVAYQDASNSSYGTVIVGTVSGTSISFGSSTIFESASTSYTSATYDSTNSKVVIAYADAAPDGKAVVFQNASSNSADFIGISDAAISDTASGSVTIKGGISTNVTGLTANALYYVQDDGSLSSPTVSIPYDITSATYADKSFSIAAQEANPRGLAINPAGTKLFVLGSTGDDVNEYALSIAFDVSSASFTQAFSIASQENNPWGITFNTDGTKMFTTGLTGVGVDEFALSVGFDVSTASFTQFLSTSAQTATPRGIAFNPTGTKMFVVDYSAASVDEYTLSSGFNVSTASYSQTFSVSAQVTEPVGLAFSTDGTEMFVTMQNTTYELTRYSLLTAFDISTASYTQRLNVQSATPVDPTENKPVAISFNSTGNKFILLGGTNDTLYQYAVSLGSTSTVLAGKALSSTSINLDYTT